MAQIELFLATTGMPATTFGLQALNDGHLVRNLRAGLDPKSSTVDRLRDFMRNYRPLARRKAKDETRAVA